jgi:hypothetical protein
LDGEILLVRFRFDGARLRVMLQLCVLLVLGLAAGSALAQEDPCAKFSWNIEHERALFATAPEAVAAGRDAATTPLLVPERLYQLQLAPQDHVALALPPGKQPKPDGAYAGMARLRLQQPGTYRVSVDQPLWIDVVADGKMIESADFQGRPGCLAPHKIVQYSLAAGRDLLLQLSGAVSPGARLTITQVDAGTTAHGR